MANCRECGNLLKYVFEVKDNQGLCSNCGPGSTKHQVAHGATPKVAVRAVNQSTRPAVIINHPDGHKEEFDVDAQPGKSVVTIPRDPEAQADFVESMAPTKQEADKSNEQDFSGVAESSGKSEGLTWRQDLTDEIMRLNREIAMLKGKLSAIQNPVDNDTTQDLTPRANKKGLTNAKRSKNSGKRRTKASRKKSSQRKNPNTGA